MAAIPNPPPSCPCVAPMEPNVQRIVVISVNDPGALAELNKHLADDWRLLKVQSLGDHKIVVSIEKRVHKIVPIVLENKFI